MTAAPIVKEILEDSLRYLDVSPRYTDKEEGIRQKEVVLPEVRNITVKEASKILIDNNLQFNTEPEYYADENATVVDMFPKPDCKNSRKIHCTLIYKT